MLAREEKKVEIDGNVFTFRRPGMAGLERVMRRMAASLTAENDPLFRFEATFGRALEARALLSEYLVDAPAGLRARDGTTCPVTHVALAWDFDEVSPGFFLKLAEEVRAFHGKFRSENNSFGLESRDGAT